MANNSWYSPTDGVMASVMDAVDSAMGGITGALTGLGSSAKELVANTWGMVTGGSNSPVDMGRSVMGESAITPNNAIAIETPAASVSPSQMAAIVSGLGGNASVVSDIANNPSLTFSSQDLGDTGAALAHNTFIPNQVAHVAPVAEVSNIRSA